MSLREQFEAWALKHKPGMWKFESETAWQAYQAGYAARKKEVDDRETAWAMDALENSLKPTRSTPRTPINEVDY